MPLPTYKKQVQQVATPKQIGSGGNAAAGMIASAQASQSLAQRLSGFSNQLTGVAKGMAKDQAGKDAVRDIYVRKQKVSDINNNPNLSDEDKQKQIDSLTEGVEKKSFGVYSKAYESAAASAYSNQLATDAKAAYDLAMTQSGGDPQTFMKMYSAFGKETVQGAPTEATSILAQQTATKYGAAGYRSLMQSSISKNTAANRKRNNDNYEAISSQFADAFYAQDEIEIARLGTLAAEAGNAAVRDGLISEEENQTRLGRMADKAIMDSTKRQFSEELNIGNGDVAFLKFRMAEKNGYFDTIDPDEVSKFKSSMMRQIKEYNDNELAQIEFEIKQSKVISEQTFNSNVQHIAQGILTEEDITYQEQQGLISASHAMESRERLAVGDTRPISDAKVLGSYAESHSLIDASVDSILNNVYLSNPDKTALVQKREKLIEEKFNWTASDDGREAVRRIKSEFGIQEGMFIAQLDMTNEIDRDYNAMYKKFYAEVSKSEAPKDEALGIADRLITEYTNEKKAKEDAQIAQRKQAQIEEAKRLKAIDDEALHFPWWDEKPLEHYMMQE